MTTFAILHCAIEDRASYDRFSDFLVPTTPAHGAVIVARLVETKWLHGSGPLRAFILVEFPSTDAAHRWHGSPEAQTAFSVGAEAGQMTVTLAEN